MRFNRNWDKLDKQSIRSMQDRKLKDFLRNQVARFSPYYSRLAKEGKFPVDKVKTIEDLKYLPFTCKEDMVPSKDNPLKPREFILQPDPKTVSNEITFARKFELIKRRFFKGESFKFQLLEEYLPVFFTATTGRSALQVPFLYTHYDVLRLKESGRRLFEISDMQPGRDTVLNLFPYAPHLAFWAVYSGAESSNVPAFHSGGGRVMGTSRILTLIPTLHPTAIAGVPGYIYHLLRVASEQGIDMSSVKRLALGAERTTEGHRKKFKAFLKSCNADNVDVLSTYGLTEARMAFIECPGGECKGYHLYPDMGIFEIINPESGERVGEGEPGEIVFTTLDSRGSVVVRFRTGDYAHGGIHTEPCPSCGRTIPRLDSNITRLSSKKELNLTKIKGTLINLSMVDEVIHHFSEIIEWQIEIGKVNNDPLENDKLTLHISVINGTDVGNLVRQLECKFIDVFEFTPNEINVETTEQVLQRLGMETELKEKRIVDLRGNFG